MSALRAVTDTDTATDRHAVQPTAGDCAPYDARMDPEAKLLCALMWITTTPDEYIVKILNFLTPSDFRRPDHGRLFALICDQVAAGAPLDPTILAGKCDAAGADGRTGWPEGKTPQQYILDIASLQALPSQVGHFAELVIMASYRRQFQSMATYLSQVAAEADVDDMFGIMVEQGRRQRVAVTRLDAFRREVLGHTNPAEDGEDRDAVHDEEPDA